MICAQCGGETKRVVLRGVTVCCPRCASPDNAAHVHAVQSDRLPNPWIENLDHEPVYCETKADLQREMDKRNLRLMDRWAGPGDRHLTNWAAGIDAQTLANVTALLARGGRAEPEPETRCETLQMTVREIAKLSDVR